MSFTDKQNEALAAPLIRSNVKTRSQAGFQLSYIEGWWAISEANRIFGFDGWDRETVELKQLGEPRMVEGKQRVSYMARVRVTVRAPFNIVRDGCGYGSGIDRDLGQAHESALKEAETDAMKRALMTFGNPFGLALYDKSQENVVAAGEALRGPSEAIQERNLSVAPEGKDFWHCSEDGLNASQAKKAGMDALHERMRQDIITVHSGAGMREWIEANLADIKKMPRSWRVILRADCEEQAEHFSIPEMA